LVKAEQRVKDLLAAEKILKDQAAELNLRHKTALAELEKLKQGGKGVDKQLADLADKLAAAQKDLTAAQVAKIVAEAKFAALQNDAKDALGKQAALRADLIAKEKVLLARETEVKNLTAINANLTLQKQNFDKTLEAKNVALKKLEQENAKLNEDAVVAKAEALAAKTRADDATRLAEVLRDRLKKYENLAKADDEQLQGTWRVSQYKKIGNGAGVAMKFIFKGDELIIETGGAGAPPRGKFKLNPKATPKTLDWLNPDGEVAAIYSLNNDELTITFSRGKERPTDFTPKTGDWSAYVLQRVK
jgi:uncharacterized protein (TIGR03067 family)